MSHDEYVEPNSWLGKCQKIDQLEKENAELKSKKQTFVKWLEDELFDYTAIEDIQRIADKAREIL